LNFFNQDKSKSFFISSVSLRVKKDIKDQNLAMAHLDRVIRSAQETAGTLTNALAKEIPALAELELWQDIVTAVRLAFDGKKSL
jgi:hypothetical protein